MFMEKLESRRLDSQCFLPSLVTTIMLCTALHYSSCGPAFYIEVKPFVALRLINWLGVGIVKTSLNKGHAALKIHEHNSLLLCSVYSAQAFMDSQSQYYSIKLSSTGLRRILGASDLGT